MLSAGRHRLDFVLSNAKILESASSPWLVDITDFERCKKTVLCLGIKDGSLGATSANDILGATFVIIAAVAWVDSDADAGLQKARAVMFRCHSGYQRFGLLVLSIFFYRLYIPNTLFSFKTFGKTGT